MRSISAFATALLGLATFAALPAQAGPVFSEASYASSLTLAGGHDTPMTVAFDGVNYLSGSGGGSTSPEAMYSGTGAQLAVASPSPGIDFRSLFSDATGAIYARGFNSNVIYKQTSFSNFTPFVTLDGTLDSQMQVVLDSNGSRYIGNINGQVQEWSLSGALIGTVTLGPNFNASNGLDIASAGGYWLNYNNSTLSAYDETTGQLVDSTILVGAGSGHYGQGYANGYFFVPNNDGSGYSGYAVSLSTAVPEPGSLALILTGLGGIALVASRRRRAQPGLACWAALAPSPLMC